MIDLPDAFLSSISRQLHSEMPAFLATYENEAVRALRRNPLKPVPDSALPPHGLTVPWEHEGILIPSDSAAGTHPLHEAGAWYLQEPGAMLPVAVLNPQPGEKVLDLCAAPGGKSTQIAGRMLGRGLLVCNEPVKKRAMILSRNIERLGVTNALVVSAAPEALAGQWPEGFDAVLVDAPCSGEGMFRRHPETISEWSPQIAEGCAVRQTGILEAASMLVRPGGRLVYSTCTFNSLENEENVKAFLLRHRDFSLQAFSLPGAAAPDGHFTCWPHHVQTEGQFAALLVRHGDGKAILPPSARQHQPDRTALRCLASFCAQAPRANLVIGNTLACLPFYPDCGRIPVLRAGLHLGEARENYFMPDHALAMACEHPPFPCVPVSAEEARRFQAGEILRVDEGFQGWVYPTLSGLPLGWGKAVSGQLKNHYPKGLRRP